MVGILPYDKKGRPYGCPYFFMNNVAGLANDIVDRKYCEGGNEMAGLSQMEFNSIREIAGGHITCAHKLNDYASKCTDPQIKQMFEKAAKDAANSAQKLAGML